MNMDLDAATKEAPTLTLDPFAEAKAEIVEKKPEELVEEQAVPEMELTPEEQKQRKEFAFTKEGVEEAADWLNEQYEVQRPMWELYMTDTFTGESEWMRISLRLP